MSTKRASGAMGVVRDPKTNMVTEYRVPKKARTAGTSVVVAEKKGGELVLADSVNRTSALMAPTMHLTGHQDAVYTAKFNPEGTNLATAGKEKLIFLWQVYGDCNNFMVLKGHKSPVVEVAWSRDGEQLFSASADKDGAVWDVATGDRLKRLKGHKLYVNAISAARRGEPLCLTGSDDCTAALWDVRKRAPVQVLQHDYQVLSVAFSDDSAQLFTAGIDNIVRCWDSRKSDTPLYLMEGHKDSITGISLSPDGNHILSNSMDNTLRTWDVRPFVSGKSRAVSVFEGAQHDFQKLMLRCAWSPDGQRITCGSSDRFVYMWNVETKQIEYKLPGHNGSVNEVVFHPSEPIIASASSDKTIFMGEFAN